MRWFARALSCSPSNSLSYKCISTNQMELTCVCVCHDSLKCVTWLLQMCGMSCSYLRMCKMTESYLSTVWHDSSIFVIWLSHMCDKTHAYVWYDLCDMVRSFLWLVSFYAWHESSMCVTWLIQMRDMTHSYMPHNSFMCVPWPARCNTKWTNRKQIQICDMTSAFQLAVHCNTLWCNNGGGDGFLKVKFHKNLNKLLFSRFLCFWLYPCGILETQELFPRTYWTYKTTYAYLSLLMGCWNSEIPYLRLQSH